MKVMIVAWMIAASVVTAAGPASAQVYPDRAVKIIIPFGPGGATDILGRLMADEMSKMFNQPFVVENRAGANGTIGVKAVANAKPDGYTLGVAAVGATAILPFIDPALSINPTKDIATVGLLSILDFILCTRADFEPNDLNATLAYAKANSGLVTYGSTGIASPGHVFHEELARRAGAKMLHIPFSGEGQIVTALLSGQIDIGYVTVTAATNLIKAGKVKALAVGGLERVKQFPELPTVAEVTRFDDYKYIVWNILVVPKTTDATIVQKLNTALNKTFESPIVKERVDKLGITVLGGNLEQAESFFNAELVRYQKLIRDNDIRQEQ